MKRTFKFACGLLVVSLASHIVRSDEPPVKQVASPDAKAPDAKQAEAKQAEAKQAEAKQAEAKQANAKQSDEKDKKKVPAPAGYEDAPEAQARRPAQRAAAAEMVMEALEAGGAAQVLDLQVDAQVRNLEKQLLPQFTPLMTAELSFINRACELNLEQRKKIKAASEQCLKGVVRQYALAQNGLIGGQFRGRQRVAPDPTDLIHQALAKVLQETLLPDQQADYAGEMAERAAHRRRVTIENMVAMIDQRLVLSSDQRRKLTDAVDKNWQSVWGQSIEMMLQNNQHLPNVPDQVIVPTLNETQKQVWQSIPKVNFSASWGFNWGNQGGAVDDFPLVDAVAEVERESSN